MTKTQFDEIQKAKHYNSHPSGIECKDIAKHLGFYLGNAAKYLWRMHEKHADPLPDLKKAAFYVSEYIEGVVKDVILPVQLPKVGGNPHSGAAQLYNAQVHRLITKETDATAGVFWALVLQRPDHIRSLQTALSVIQNRIIFEDSPVPGAGDDDEPEYRGDPSDLPMEREPLHVTAKDFS